MKTPLRVMKFGGTSVGDAACILRAVEIIRTASRESQVVVVVSALSGVTNRVLEAADCLATGRHEELAAIFEELRARHEVVAADLLRSSARRRQMELQLRQIFSEARDLCRAAQTSSAAQTRDFIAGLGERLAAPLISAALAESGIPSQPVDARELIVTDSNHGAAEPIMKPTRARCHARLRPLLQQDIVPVVTGFIAATEAGLATTLGRGGSDYSATIIAAALAADEVIIWKDVDGLMTADPLLVSDASTIPEISYREAAELAYFGAKVLHHKTVQALAESRIPLWVRNSFAPERPGTRIAPVAASTGAVRALSAASSVALITIEGRGIASLSDVLERGLAQLAAGRAEPMLVSRCSSRNCIQLAVSSALATSILKALLTEFSADLAKHRLRSIALNPNAALLSIICARSGSTVEIKARALQQLCAAGVSVLAAAEGASECNVSFALPKNDLRAALALVHHEFRLSAPAPQPILPKIPAAAELAVAAASEQSVSSGS